MYVLVCAYKVHMYVYMLGGGIKSGLTAFFFEHMFSSEKRKAKDVNIIHET